MIENRACDRQRMARCSAFQVCLDYQITPISPPTIPLPFPQHNQHGEVARDKVAPHHIFGLDGSRPDNLRYIERGKAMYAAGNALVILETTTMRRRLIMGIDGRGIGCFAIHLSRDFVAVGEKGTMPNIYIYEYPSFRVVKVRG